MRPVHDPQAIRNPRPDFAGYDSNRNIQWGWNPVGAGKNIYDLTKGYANGGKVNTKGGAKGGKKKERKVKIRGTGAATKGLFSRGPMG